MTVIRWLKREGDAVEARDVVAELELDKVTAEFEAPVAGILRTILVIEGEEVRTSEPLAVIGEG